MKYTPGPLYCHEINPRSYYIADQEGYPIARVSATLQSAAASALKNNVHLWAEAPDLLEALHQIIRYSVERGSTSEECARIAYGAINKIKPNHTQSLK